MPEQEFDPDTIRKLASSLFVDDRRKFRGTPRYAERRSPAHRPESNRYLTPETAQEGRRAFESLVKRGCDPYLLIAYATARVKPDKREPGSEGAKEYRGIARALITSLSKTARIIGNPKARLRDARANLAKTVKLIDRLTQFTPIPAFAGGVLYRELAKAARGGRQNWPSLGENLKAAIPLLDAALAGPPKMLFTERDDQQFSLLQSARGKGEHWPYAEVVRFLWPIYEANGIPPAEYPSQDSLRSLAKRFEKNQRSRRAK